MDDGGVLFEVKEINVVKFGIDGKISYGMEGGMVCEMKSRMIVGLVVEVEIG